MDCGYFSNDFCDMRGIPCVFSSDGDDPYCPILYRKRGKIVEPDPYDWDVEEEEPVNEI